MLKISSTVTEVRRWIATLKPSIAGSGRTAYALPVLTAIRIDVSEGQATLSATNLESTTRISGLDATGQGSTLLRLADLVSALRNAKGTVTIEALGQNDLTRAADHDVYITTSNGLAGFRPLELDEYPRARKDEDRTEVGYLVVDPERASRVATAAGKDDARPILTTVLPDVKNQRLVSTDSYRLALTPAEVVAFDEKHLTLGLLPATWVTHLAKVADEPVKIRMFEREAEATVPVSGGLTVTMTTTVVEGEFPPYERLLPRTFPTKLALPGDLIPAMKALPAEYATPVRIVIEDEVLKVTFTIQDVGTRVLLEEPCPGYTNGTLAYNPEYLAEGMGMCGGDVEFHFIDALKPMAFTGAGVTYLLMPVRVEGGPKGVIGHLDVTVAPHTLPEPVAVASTKPKVTPKRTGKPELVAFLRSIARDLPADAKAEADRLLAAA